MEKVYIFGHQLPDTDSITSAISLSYLKNQLGMQTIPARLGTINDETKFVLDYFKVKHPILLNDVKLQIKDLNYHKGFYINQKVSIEDTYHYMMEKGITGVPVVDDFKKFKGLVTVKMIAEELINGNFSFLSTSYDNILKTLKGETILRFEDEIEGNILAASYRSTTFINTIHLEKNNILIVGDRHSVIEYAVSAGIKLLIIIGNGEIKPEHLEIAKQNHVNIMKTSFDTFYTTKILGFSNYIKNIVPDDRPYTFDENTYYDEFIVKTNKLQHNNYPIIDKNGICKGLIRITEIADKKRKKVILVDHNELEQSADGLEEAEILEIVDHHKIGNVSTKNPINFRTMSVGCTNTIIYQMYQENKIEIPKEIAGIMLSGILSDTLALTSPTTTELDIKTVESLAKIVELDYHEYALNMFKAWASLEGKTVADIVGGDIKTYDLGELSFAVSQSFTVGTENLSEKKEQFITYLNQYVKDHNYRLVLFLVTDIIKNGSYLFYNESAEEIIADAYNLKEIKQGIYMDGLVARKKQVVPAIMEVIR